MSIEIKALNKKYGNFTALHEIDLVIPEGELVALLGPSGSGKTTLLRIIGGMEIPDSGNVLFGGEAEAQRKIAAPRIGFVFQNYALFRHMTVFDNVAFGLKVRPRRLRPSKKEIRVKVAELLKLVQLEGLENRYPDQLSGGQRQRVALARALAIEPQVLLLDEPFGALDAKVRQELRRWLRQLHHELDITTIFVTHDQEEALEVADQVVVMNQGKVEQVGTPWEVYQQPANPFVYQFLGQVNQVRGRIQDGKAKFDSLEWDLSGYHHPDGKECIAFVRPHEVEITTEPAAQRLQGRVTQVYPVGARVRLEVEIKGNSVPIEVDITEEYWQQSGLAQNRSVFIAFKKPRIFIEGSGFVDLDISDGSFLSENLSTNKRVHIS